VVDNLNGLQWARLYTVESMENLDFASPLV